jgi:hypothetical protein
LASAENVRLLGVKCEREPRLASMPRMESIWRRRAFTDFQRISARAKSVLFVSMFAKRVPSLVWFLARYLPG